MNKFIKRLFCKHKQSKQVFRVLHHGGKTYRNYGRECDYCGKEWWLR